MLAVEGRPVQPSPVLPGSAQPRPVQRTSAELHQGLRRHSQFSVLLFKSQKRNLGWAAVQ